PPPSLPAPADSYPPRPASAENWPTAQLRVHSATSATPSRDHPHPPGPAQGTYSCSAYNYTEAETHGPFHLQKTKPGPPVAHSPPPTTPPADYGLPPGYANPAKSHEGPWALYTAIPC